MAEAKLRSTPSPSRTPRYEIWLDGRLVGTVFRTGSLPSCYRWFANFASSALGQGHPRLRSKSTRKAAVDELLSHLNPEETP